LSGLNFLEDESVAVNSRDNQYNPPAPLDAEEDLRYDPEPLTIILEIANLVFQPGSLATLASGISAATGVMLWMDAKDKHRTEIRRKLYEIDRALVDGFSALMVLASLLDQFNHLKKPIRVGGAPITGFKNAQRLRKAHEDCRAAVKDARDAFSDLSGLLPNDTRELAEVTIRKLNELSQDIMRFGQPYGTFLSAASQALTVVDIFICQVGKNVDFNREPRFFSDSLVQSFPGVPKPPDLGFLR
jgi:hypothetical protein